MFDNYTAERNANLPGPGLYQPKVHFDGKGQYFVSNIRSSQGPTFGVPNRNSPRFLRERGNITPGPGQYKYTLGIGNAGAWISTI